MLRAEIKIWLLRSESITDAGFVGTDIAYCHGFVAFVSYSSVWCHHPITPPIFRSPGTLGSPVLPVPPRAATADDRSEPVTLNSGAASAVGTR
jgi:hypothetical protein